MQFFKVLHDTTARLITDPAAAGCVKLRLYAGQVFSGRLEEQLKQVSVFMSAGLGGMVVIKAGATRRVVRRNRRRRVPLLYGN
jgi:hypothetical protein